MPTRPDIEAAHVRVEPHVRRTPMLALEAGALCDAPVALKIEASQVTGSFKARGAFNFLLTNPTPPAGVATFSGGNHGAALAHAATSLGVRSTVFTASFTDPLKLGRMRGFGADVDVSEDFTIAQARCAEFVARTGALYVHPYDHPAVLAGQGTVGREIDLDMPDIDTLLVSVGGGGLIGGIAGWFEGRVRIVAVESEGTPTLATAIAQGRDVTVPAHGLAASSLGAPVIGQLAFDILTRFPVERILVTDREIVAAQMRLWEAARLVGEPGAAAALAPLVSGAYQPRSGERVAALICGGNATPGWFLD